VTKLFEKGRKNAIGARMRVCILVVRRKGKGRRDGERIRDVTEWDRRKGKQAG